MVGSDKQFAWIPKGRLESKPLDYNYFPFGLEIDWSGTESGGKPRARTITEMIDTPKSIHCTEKGRLAYIATVEGFIERFLLSMLANDNDAHARLEEAAADGDSAVANMEFSGFPSRSAHCQSPMCVRCLPTETDSATSKSSMRCCGFPQAPGTTLKAYLTVIAPYSPRHCPLANGTVLFGHACTRRSPSLSCLSSGVSSQLLCSTSSAMPAMPQTGLTPLRLSRILSPAMSQKRRATSPAS